MDSCGAACRAQRAAPYTTRTSRPLPNSLDRPARLRSDSKAGSQSAVPAFNCTAHVPGVAPALPDTTAWPGIGLGRPKFIALEMLNCHHRPAWPAPGSRSGYCRVEVREYTRYPSSYPYPQRRAYAASAEARTARPAEALTAPASPAKPTRKRACPRRFIYPFDFRWWTAAVLRYRLRTTMHRPRKPGGPVSARHEQLQWLAFNAEQVLCAGGRSLMTSITWCNIADSVWLRYPPRRPSPSSHSLSSSTPDGFACMPGTPAERVR